MANSVFSAGCLVGAIQQYTGQKHYLACTAKAFWNACAGCHQAPHAMLVHRDNLCEYSIRAGKVIKRVELKVTHPGKRSEKAHDFTAAFCGGILYMFGGCWTNNKSMTTVAKFSVQEHEWSWGAPMPTARSAACAVTAGAIIYVIGGRIGEMKPLDDDIRTVEKYDTLNDDWATAPSLNRPRAYCSALLVGSFIFVLGGSKSLCLERLDLNRPLAWEDFPVKMPISRHSSVVAVAIHRKIYVLGGWNRHRINIAKSGSVLDLDTNTWSKTPPLPANHNYFSQAVALDGAIYLFGASGSGGVNKYEPETSRWLTLPGFKEGKEGCYLAFLAEGPSHSPRLFPFQTDEQTGPVHAHQLIDARASVIQDVQHSDEAAASVDPAEAAALVAEQWAQRVELNVGAASSDSQMPGLLSRLLLLSFTRHPAEFHTTLLEGSDLASCREQMRGLPCRLDAGALVFVEPFQYTVAIEAAMRHQGHLAAYHVITSERFEPDVMQAVRGLKSRSNVRLRSKQTILQPFEVQVVRTFLDVPDRCLRSWASVTHSTTDAHGGRNHRTLCS